MIEGTKLNALVVEDNLHMLRIIAAILKSFGIEHVQGCQDPVEALELLKTNPYDLLFVDRNLPIIDGLEITRLIRQDKDSINTFVPIIMITAYTERSSIREARDAGVTELCAKPVTANTIWKRVVAVVNKPRPFVRSENYFGPDRRRRDDPRYKGPEKRADRVEQTGLMTVEL